MKMKVGFIGLGLMGNPMAKNILKSGFSLTIYNRTQKRTEDLKNLGAKVALSPSALAKEVDIVITMITAPKDVKEVLFGKSGVAQGTRKRKSKNKLIVVDMSTIGVKAAREIGQKLEKQGIEFLDAPVTGSVPGAIGGTLTIFIGGKESIVAKVKPVFQSLGKTFLYMGKMGNGQAIKLVNNLIIAGTLATLAEGIHLGNKVGLTNRDLEKALSVVPAVSPMMNLKMPNMLKNSYPAIFTLSNMNKDLTLAQEEISGKKNLPLLKLLNELHKRGVDLGFGEEDLSVIFKV